MDSKGKNNEQTKDNDKGDKPQGGLAANGKGSREVTDSVAIVNAIQESMTIAVSENILYRMDEEDKIPKRGPAFPFVKALVRLNGCFEGNNQARPFDIVLMTNTQERVQDAIKSLGPCPIRVQEDDVEKLLETRSDKKILYLTESSDRAETAIAEGLAAAIMFPNHKDEATNEDESELRVAFDGDGVLFSDESEVVFKTQGLDAFTQNEKDNENLPLNKGPLKGFLEFLHGLQRNLPRESPCKVKTCLVTSRSPNVCGTRALNTLTSWDLEISQAFFLSGSSKGPILAASRPHIFFDDQQRHTDDALKHRVTAAHVPYGIGYKTPLNPAESSTGTEKVFMKVKAMFCVVSSFFFQKK